jgi:hypothetical protein
MSRPETNRLLRFNPYKNMSSFIFPLNGVQALYLTGRRREKREHLFKDLCLQQPDQLFLDKIGMADQADTPEGDRLLEGPDTFLMICREIKRGQVRNKGTSPAGSYNTHQAVDRARLIMECSGRSSWLSCSAHRA